MKMHAAARDAVVEMPEHVLDRLLPMHLRVDADGIIRHVGPTAAKLAGDVAFVGRPLLEVFTIRRPSGVETFDVLLRASDLRLGLSLKAAEHMPFRGVLMHLPGEAGAIVNLSLGLSFARAVAEFSLTLSDFSATDQTVDLLYLNEARTSTTRLSEHLTRRLQDAHDTAQHQARTDVLTGLSNRRAMDAELDHLMASRNQSFSLMHLDLDLFKQVNDTYGHAAGDAVLTEIGKILDQELRRNDFPARMGGDEFLIILRPAQSDAVITRVARRIIRRIEEPIRIGGVEVRISASIGVASTPDYLRRPPLAQLMADVDEALYTAKRNGRGQISIFKPQLE
ncbi:diguanylate cyclase [Rhodobacterales bacterium HKCCE4037]|nr:diguanylate cyclase [Rhodobacterales bacterium HKCCE4037]